MLTLPCVDFAIASTVFLAIALGVLARGYWFAATHGSLYMDVTDVADREHTRHVIPVDLAFLRCEGPTSRQGGGRRAGRCDLPDVACRIRLPRCGAPGAVFSRRAGGVEPLLRASIALGADLD